jgi:hypothetical protein
MFKLMYDAVKCGQLECLKYLIDNGGQLTANMIDTTNHFGMIQYLYQQGLKGSLMACLAAAENGNLETLIFLLTHDCPYDNVVAEMAAKCGRLDCLKYLHRNGYSIDHKAMHAALDYWHKDCFLYLTENGYNL